MGIPDCYYWRQNLGRNYFQPENLYIVLTEVFLEKFIAIGNSNAKLEVREQNKKPSELLVQRESLYLYPGWDSNPRPTA